MQRKHLALSALVVASAAALAPAPAAAQTVRIQNGEVTDSVARLVDRRAPSAAEFAIVSTDGNRALLLVPGGVVLQLTDAGLERVARPPAEPRADQGPIARLVEGMARGGLRVLLDRGLEYELTALKEVRAEGGRLFFEDRDGKPLFDRMTIDGQEFLEGFAERDARAFAARVNRRL